MIGAVAGAEVLDMLLYSLLHTVECRYNAVKYCKELHK